MDRKSYTDMIENINVSQATVEKVLNGAYILQSGKGCRRRNRLRILIPLAALLSVSVITVSAARLTGLSDLFGTYFSQLFPDSAKAYNQDQIDFIEQNGTANVPDFVRDGVAMNIDGIIGDRDFVFIRYSVSKTDGYGSGTYSSFINPMVYIGELSKDKLPASFYSSTIQEDDPSAKHIGLLVYADKGAVLSGEDITFVMRGYSKYTGIGINLAEVFDEYGSAPVNDSSDPYDIPDLDLDIPFNNEYGGSLRLDSIGCVNGRLVLAVDTSDYYKIPEIFLRNKRTGEIYRRCDGLTTAGRDGVEYWPYNAGGIEELKDLEIVMPAEYHFTFPLSYTDNTRELDLFGQSSMMLGGITIDSVRISPLSIVIEGKADEYGNSISAYKDCSIRLKDGTVQRFSEKGFLNMGDDGIFKTGVPFGEPLMPESIESLIIDAGNDSVELPVD
jgi:hypothetical protein